jgi:hypothetical protein
MDASVSGLVSGSTTGRIIRYSDYLKGLKDKNSSNQGEGYGQTADGVRLSSRQKEVGAWDRIVNYAKKVVDFWSK